VDFNQFLAF